MNIHSFAHYSTACAPVDRKNKSHRAEYLKQLNKAGWLTSPWPWSKRGCVISGQPLRAIIKKMVFRKCMAAAVSARKKLTPKGQKEGPRMTLCSPKLSPCISHCCWPCTEDLPECCTCCSITAAPQQPPLKKETLTHLWCKKLKFCSEQLSFYTLFMYESLLP